MAGLLDFAQAASNSAAGNVAGPIDMLAWGLRKMGIPIPNDPVLGTEWMKQKGLIKEVPQSPASLAGETLGLLSPIVAAAKAPQIAGGLLQMGDNLTTAKTLGSGPGGGQKGAIVYHGSPHKFDKFDSSKIGTGEGAQAYGHGLYLAESPDVAKSYAESVSRLHGATTTVEGAGRKVPVPLWAADRVKSEGIDSLIDEWSKRLAESQAKAKTSTQPWIEQANASRFAQQIDELKTIKAGGAVNVEAPGSLYKVDLPDSAVARMLDWDKPLSQQAPEVQKSWEKFAASSKGKQYAESLGSASNMRRNKFGRPELEGMDLWGNLRGAYESSADDAAIAADFFKRGGVPGIRYLDGGSRGAGQGTSNFVVFPGNEGLLTILERNGVPLR